MPGSRLLCTAAADPSKAVVVYLPDVVHVKTPFGVLTRQLDRADIEASRHKGMAAGRLKGRPEFAAICDGSAAANPCMRISICSFRSSICCRQA